MGKSQLQVIPKDLKIYFEYFEQICLYLYEVQPTSFLKLFGLTFFCGIISQKTKNKKRLIDHNTCKYICIQYTLFTQ